MLDSANVKHRWCFFAFTTLLLISVLVYCSLQGALAMSFLDIFAKLPAVDALIDNNSTAPANNYFQIWLHIRLPRILAALLIGAMLAVSGASMQGVFRNPLVDPGIVGILSGAALAATLFIVFGGFLLAFIPAPYVALFTFYALPFAAFIGGWVVMMLLYSLAKRSGNINIATMLLLGIVINAIAGAITALVIYAADDSQLRSITFWSMGSLSGISWPQIALLTVAAVIGIPLLLRDASALNAILIGENVATHIGLDVEKVKKRQLLTVAFLVGCSVAVAGGIGFIGLVIPHICRNILGTNHKYLLPACVLVGAIILIISDTLARIIVSPAELPIGILTAIIGAPFLGYLVWQNISSQSMR